MQHGNVYAATAAAPAAPAATAPTPISMQRDCGLVVLTDSCTGSHKRGGDTCSIITGSSSDVFASCGGSNSSGRSSSGGSSSTAAAAGSGGSSCSIHRSGGSASGCGNSGCRGSGNSGSCSSGSGSGSDSVAVEQLVEQLSDDVYALTVKTVLRGVRGVQLAHMLLGLLFTVALQLGLLIPLWYVVAHSTYGKEPDSYDQEAVWMQVRQLQGQLCGMQAELNQYDINISSNVVAQADCSRSWPQPRKRSYELDHASDAPTLIVNFLALMAVAVFVHDEVRRAVTLCHTAAAVAGILPAFYATSITKGWNKADLHWSLCLVVLSTPLLQMMTALLVLLSATLLLMTQEVQASSIQVVLNSVALGFLLEVDNKIGQMISAQQQQSAGGSTLLRSLALSTCLHDTRLRSCLGHAYFAAVGLLLALEPMLLAPHAVVAVVVGVRLLQDPQGEFAQQELGVDDTWSCFLGLKMCFNNNRFWVFATVDTVVASCYMLLVVALVLLLFYKPLPSAAARWPPTLSAVQALTACFAACYAVIPKFVMAFDFTNWTASTMVMFCTFLLVCCTWVCMFIVWPTCHKGDARHQGLGPRCCCHAYGTCQECCTICCSIGCDTTCSTRCGTCCGTYC